MDMDADAFSLLVGGGVRFDKKRFSKDIETLSKPRAESSRAQQPEHSNVTESKPSRVEKRGLCQDMINPCVTCMPEVPEIMYCTNTNNIHGMLTHASRFSPFRFTQR